MNIQKQWQWHLSTCREHENMEMLSLSWTMYVLALQESSRIKLTMYRYHILFQTFFRPLWLVDKCHLSQNLSSDLIVLGSNPVGNRKCFNMILLVRNLLSTGLPIVCVFWLAWALSKWAILIWYCPSSLSVLVAFTECQDCQDLLILLILLLYTNLPPTSCWQESIIYHILGTISTSFSNYIHFKYIHVLLM